MAHNTNIRGKILELKNQGFNQNQTRLRLGCSSATVHYHWSDDRKRKINSKNATWKKNNAIQNKLMNFIYKSTKVINEKHNKYLKCFSERLANKIYSYKTNIKDGVKDMLFMNDVKEMLLKKPYCYLTGRKLDLYDTRSYHFDHKIPTSRGGDASITNLGVCCRAANQAKNDMTPEEFIEFCKEVLEFNGYQVNKVGI
jgi:5-methylcytosine-specific restriction endonuclease McrA